MNDLVAAYYEDDQWNVLDDKDPIREIADGLWYGVLEPGEEDTWAIGTVDEDDVFHPLAQATFTNTADSDCFKFARDLMTAAAIAAESSH